MATVTAISILPAYRQIVLHALGKETLTVTQIAALATELNKAELKATLGALETEGKIIKDGKAYAVAPTVHSCCKQPAGQSHATDCPKFPDAKTAIPPRPTAKSKTEKATEKTVAAMETLHDAVAVGRPGMPSSQRIFETKLLLEQSATAHFLMGTTRVEIIPELMAKMRNRDRKDDKKWVIVPPSDPLQSQAVVPGFLKIEKQTPEQREEAADAARTNEQVWWEAYVTAKARHNSPIRTEKTTGKHAANTSTDGEPAKVRATQAPKPAGSTKVLWMGLASTSFIRVCGAAGLTKPETFEAVKAAGFDPSPTTVNIQFNAGVKKQNIPALDKEQQAAFALLKPGGKKTTKAKPPVSKATKPVAKAKAKTTK